MDSPGLSGIAPAPAIPFPTPSASPITAVRSTQHHSALSDTLSAAPPARPPRARPINTGHPAAPRADADRSFCSSPLLPLVLCCIKCQHSSVWFNPSGGYRVRRASTEMAPSLLASSRSTSSAPSSLDTDCADKLGLGPHSPPHAADLKSPASPSFTTEALSDGQTPVVAKFKIESCGQRQSGLVNTQNWVGGEIQGICESCINSSEGTMQFNDSSSQSILKQQPRAAIPESADPHELAIRGRLAYPNSFFSEPSFSTSPGSDQSSPSSANSALERSRSDLQVPWQSCSMFPVDEILSSNLLSQVEQITQKPGPMFPDIPVDGPVSAATVIPFPVPSDSSDGEQPFSVTTTKPRTISRGGQKWHTDSQPAPVPGKSPPRHRVAHLSRSKDHLIEPHLVEISEMEELEDTASQQEQLCSGQPWQARSHSKQGTGDGNCKSEVTSIRSGTRSSQSASSHRGANLRSLLREAKIPLASEDPGAASRRLNTMDIWQVAMIGTPRDRMRAADLPSWQGYSSADRASAQHRRGPSTSSSFLSGHETPQSVSHQSIPGSGSIESCMTDLTSFRGESSCERAHSCSPTAERPSFSETHGLNLLGRRPSVGRKGSAKDLLTSPPLPSDSAMITSGVERHLSPSSRESHQEVLRSSAVQLSAGRIYTPMEKSPRPSPSTSNLLARFAHFHQVGDKAGKDARRRPNTATGSGTPSARPSPKPGSGVQGPSSPVSAVTGSPAHISPLFNACLPSAVELEPSRSSKLGIFKRPATATGSGSTTEPIALSVHNSPVHGRPFTANKASPSTFTPYSSTSGTSSGTQFPGLKLDYDFTLPVPGGLGRMHRRKSSGGEEWLGVSASPPSRKEPLAEPGPAALPVSKSVPNTPVKGSFQSQRRAGIHAPSMRGSEELGEPAGRRMHQEAVALSKLPPEDFYSKSRNLNLSILPRPSSGMFRPGQRVSIYVRLAAKVKARKYSSISLVLAGSVTAESDAGSGGHDFLRQSFAIHPSVSEGVRVVSGGLEASEWQIELMIPPYATCGCKPGPLPLPSSGSQGGANHVGYSFQLFADRKQLLSAQESVNVKFHLACKPEARYQVTTRVFTSSPRTGKIAFAGGYLGSIESYSLSHQIYFQSSERLRIGYQFEIELSPHSFLPLRIAEEVCKAAKVGVRSLVGDQTQLCGLSFVDHRSKIHITPAERTGEVSKWLIKGYLEVKNVQQQMEFLRATLETAQRGVVGRHLETAAGTSSVGGGGFGMLMRTKYSSSGVPSTASGTGSMRTGIAGALGGGSGHSGAVQIEAERQARLSTSQLLLVASTDHCSGALTRPIEVTSLIGSELVTGCPLRRLGEEALKRTVMEEKMKKVQEEHFKNS